MTHRSAFFGTGMLVVTLVFGASGATVAGASPSTPAATPPEGCLSVETFPVGAGEHPHDVAPAADGERIWYTAQHIGAMGLLDPESGEIELIPLGAGSAPHGVIVGPDQAAWVTDSGLNAIVRVDDATHEVTVFPLPNDFPGANLNTAAFDPNGVLWFTGQAGVVGRLDPSVGTVEAVSAPRGPYGITSTPDGRVFFVSLASSYLGQINDDETPFGITRLDPPTPGQGARRVWADSRGIIWISEWNAGQLGRYDPFTEEWTEWRLPGDTPQAYAVYVDERDDVWLSDFGANTLVRFDPDTETFVSVPLPDADAAVRQIHGRPDEVWGAESASDKLIVVRTNCGEA